jgi:phosphonoacetaldehyde hydrolase
MVGVLERARQQGLQCEPVICTDDVAQGRPSPLGMYRCMLELQAGPANTVVKVDDTVPGLLEGRNAGCWTVGVVVSGNAAGLSLQQWQELDDAGRDAVRAAAHNVLAEAEPDFIIDSVADLPQLLHQLDAAILRGDAPRPIKVPRALQV